ncbi:MAG: cytochrome C [Deltaproteobacteria bacterium]|nr:cytochrome C [Deltaproteobacteria bacterium]
MIVKRECVSCHLKVTPGIVSDWLLSKHSKNLVTCSVCHGVDHMSADDVDLARPIKPSWCGKCHESRWNQFKAGKHALAWSAMKAMPTVHWQPMALVEGMKGCGGCHKIGVKSEEEIYSLREQGTGFGYASCDVCHTRHTFSVKEARQPQACQTCHMGFDHPQWEMYSSSKHGVRFLLKQQGILPENAAAATCQTCHMQEGNHEVRTAWGFMALRLPMPDDKAWSEARKLILQAYGVLKPDGNPGERFDLFKAMDVMRLTQEDWGKERDKMVKTCRQCHSGKFANGELEKGDKMIRETDILLAQAIRIVANLYADGILKKPKNYAYAYPDLLTFLDAPTTIEQRLFLMFERHRMRTFQGTFHVNPDYTYWYGWSEMQQDLTHIKEMDQELRRRAQVERQP